MARCWYVYLLANKRNGTLYVGMTDDLVKRVWEHKHKLLPSSFTSRYDVGTLVWYEEHGTAATAMLRERQIKRWNRVWKIEMLEQTNPEWIDRYAELLERIGGDMDPRFRGE